jgi:hypothetical protein
MRKTFSITPFLQAQPELIKFYVSSPTSKGFDYWLRLNRYKKMIRIVTPNCSVHSSNTIFRSVPPAVPPPS